MDNRKFLPIIVIGVVSFFVIIYLSSSIFLTIKPGERGVIFRKFTTGLDKENIFLPGFLMKLPWNDMHVYDVKETKVEERMDVLDKSGLTLSVDVSVRFHPLYGIPRRPDGQQAQDSVGPSGALLGAYRQDGV